MGQYANQPDFITNDIQAVTPVLAANLTAADSLNGSVLYIGTSAPGNIQVIPAGRVGPSVVTGAAGLGYTGSNGTGYGLGAGKFNAKAVSGSGAGLTFNCTGLPNGSVQIDSIFAAGSGYKNGDIIYLDAGNEDAQFRVIAEPGLPGTAQAQVFANVPQGEWFPVVVDYVLSDSTTVTDIIAGK